MTRLARIVIPRLPHHVTQRGNRGEWVFFSDADYQFYLDELRLAAQKAGSEIWAWRLMPNHVHLLIVPSDEDGLRLTVANTHRRHAAGQNARNKWTGHVWQGRRLIGGAGFLDALEARLGRTVKPQQRGRKRKDVEIR